MQITIFLPYNDIVAKMMKTNNELKLEQTQSDGRTDVQTERERVCINEIIGLNAFRVLCEISVISPPKNRKNTTVYKMRDDCTDV